MMIRKLVLLMVLATVPIQQALALGLGELQLQSALNQTFDAEIPLVKLEGLEPEEILPSLAAQADFDRVGVDRAAHLLDLRFKVESDGAGGLQIKIVSTKPIVEPYLNFVLEVLWPSGRLLHEYTVLLDPPVFGTAGAEPLSPALSEPEQESAPTQAEPQGTDAGASPTGATEAGDLGMTAPGDTLWSIARKVRPDTSVSIHQTIVALQRANPDAFVDGNINLLKAGLVLRVPTLAEIQQVEGEAAVTEVQAQNDAWRSDEGSRTREPLDASRDSEPQTAGAEAGSDKLRVLSADESNTGERAGAGGGGSSRGQGSDAELAMALEDLDKTKRANAELTSRLDDLNAQVETLNQLVQLKDDQLAELQAQLKQAPGAPEAPAPEAPPAAPAPAPEQAAEESPPPPAEEPAIEAEEEPAPAPEPSPFLNPLLLGAVALVLLGGGAGFAFYRRRKSSAGREQEVDLDEIRQSADRDHMGLEAVGDRTVDRAAEPVVDAEQGSEEEEDVSQQTEDVLSEADIYIAYGRFPQAETFLKNAIQTEPDRADIRLKLLEVYVQTQDRTQFNLQFQQLLQLGEPDAIRRARELQAKLPGAAEVAAAAMGATVISTAVTAIAEPVEDDDLSFDLDDLDSETAADDLEVDGLALNEEADALEEDLDLELDEAGLEEEPAAAAASKAEAPEPMDAEDLDLELDMDLGDTPVEDETRTAPVSAEVAAPSADDDLALDLEDLELDSDLGDLDADAPAEISDEADDTKARLAETAITGAAAALNTSNADLDDLSLDDAEDALGLDELEDDDLGSTQSLAIEPDDDLGSDDLDLDLDSDTDQTTDFELDEISLGRKDEPADSSGASAGADVLDIDLDLEEESTATADDAVDTDDLDLDLDDDLSLESAAEQTQQDDGELSLDDDSFDLDDISLDGDDGAGSKLDLARAYIDMEDHEGARGILEEVQRTGSRAEKEQARDLLARIG